MTEKSAFDEEQMRIEEYKLLRKTTIHFDKILHNIRKNTILCAFFLFGLSIEALRSAEILSYGLKPVYLSIGLVLIELLVSTSNLRVTGTILNRKATLRVDW